MKRPHVRFTPEAARLVSKLHPETKKFMRFAIEDLRTNPNLGDGLAEELAGFSSYKPGRYRILYKFDEERNVIDVY
jgi:mRNA-degrading endonuclease RelE of RelBE toxin-antitoxin system